MADVEINQLSRIAAPTGSAMVELEESGASGYALLEDLPVSSAAQTALDAKANDSAVVHDTGNETIAGVKTFEADPLIPDEAYDATAWNGVLEPPTKNAVRDKIETLAPLSSPSFTDDPTAPTQSQADNSTKLATTAYVRAAITAILNGVSSAFDTLAEIATELGLKAYVTPTINDQVGTTYTLQTTDNGKVVTCNNASAITVTVPSGLGAGFNCMIIQKGAGQVTLSPSSTTIRHRQSHTKTAGQWAVISLVAHAANDLTLGGDTTS